MQIWLLLLLTQMNAAKVADAQAVRQQQDSAVGGLIGTLGSAFIAAKFCWVAREVYGEDNPRVYI